MIQMTKPQKTKSFLSTLQDCTIQTAYCVLPGQDPRGSQDKDCQDDLCISQAKGYFLAALFDGHGKFGREVVETCLTFIRQQFDAQVDYLIVSPTLGVASHCPSEAS